MLVSESVLDRATQRYSVVVKSGRTGKTIKMKRGKEFFSEKPARRKAPKQEAIEEKGVVGNAGNTSPCKKAENKNLFC